MCGYFVTNGVLVMALESEREKMYFISYGVGTKANLSTCYGAYGPQYLKYAEISIFFKKSEEKKWTFRLENAGNIDIFIFSQCSYKT